MNARESGVRPERGPAIEHPSTIAFLSSYQHLERGASMAWTAILFATVLVPLLLLVIDGTRVLRVQSVLQMASDAACEDAAWSAADRAVFRETGQVTFQNNPAIWAAAQETFQAVVFDQNVMRYTPAISLFPDFTDGTVQCNASAVIQLILLPGNVTLETESISEIRFSK